jgi:hypothetical protein
MSRWTTMYDLEASFSSDLGSDEEASGHISDDCRN